MSGARDVVDVAIIGAGLSGIGAAVHLSKSCPDHSLIVFEGRSELGGTWDLFRYPGIRSDSDMHTLGYAFKPWRHKKSIADGPSILDYLRETVVEFDIDRLIRYEHMVTRAEWSSETALWTLALSVGGKKEVRTQQCRFLYVCAGYYSYEMGHTPEFEGREDFEGRIVHPQDWPSNLDHTGKSVAVIGSGATAMTLVPAMAPTAEHVTMIQRSPTYVVSMPDEDPLEKRLRRLLPDDAAYRLTRWKNILRDQAMYRTTRSHPDRVRSELVDRVRQAVGEEIAREHFTPSYDPWDQRLCVLPNGDLFDVINSGAASVVTSGIDRFTSSGVRLESGEHVEADIIVTATGLELVTLGGITVVVDGSVVDFSRTFTYRGVGYSGVPNLVSTFGYLYASWTLRSDMVSRYTCRLLTAMQSMGADTCVPTLRNEDVNMRERPFVDEFSSGYITRAAPGLPKQGEREPWLNHQRYRHDRRSLLRRPIADGAMRFRRSGQVNPSDNLLHGSG